MISARRSTSSMSNRSPPRGGSEQALVAGGKVYRREGPTNEHFSEPAARRVRRGWGRLRETGEAAAAEEADSAR